MNRIIKFRAWQKNHKKIGRVKSISFNEKSEIEHLCFHNGDNCAPVYSNYWKNHKEWDLDNLELMEFTGLKDKNGKEIYEGDIVKWVNGKHYWEAIISTLKDSKSNTLYAIETFHNCTSDEFDEIYTYERSNSRMGFRNDVEFLSKKIEVIGNIYENPELLEK